MIEFFIVFAVLLIVLQIAFSRKKKKDTRAFIEKLFAGGGSYKNTDEEFKKVKALHEYRKKHCGSAEYFPIDEITAADLSIDELYKNIDICGSFYGREVLYDMLMTPVNNLEKLKNRNSLISFFQENENDRIDIALSLQEIGRKCDMPLCESLSTVAACEKEGNVLIDYMCMLLGLFSCAVIFISPYIGFFVFFFILFTNLILYYAKKSRIAAYLSAFAGIVRLIRCTRWFVSKTTLSVYQQQLDEMKELLKEVSPIERGSVLLVSGRNATGGVVDFILDYLRMFLHLDIICFYSMLKKAAAHKERLLRLSYLIGSLDSYICIASYRKRSSFYCMPELSDKTQKLRIDELYNPLIDNAVVNDICESGCVLLTGSNASGKSTFLRSVALAAILAETIYTVPAKKYSACFMAVATSMSLKDNILKGDSYYMAEIKSIRRILDMAENEIPLLCCIDEVLRGTNTAERISASSEILKYLSDISKKSSVKCYAATHDLELVKILDGEYESYCFYEIIDEKSGDIHFPYKLEKGSSKSRNAIKLLEAMGYAKDITDRAKKRCDSYLKNGGWEI